MDALELVEVLKGHKVYIQTHNYPDPDAIASAYGLQHFLRQHQVDAQICYDGTVEKLSTRRMFEVFDIHTLSKEELAEMREEDYIVTVDSQKYNSNLTDFIGDEVACIDHHPTVIPCQYLYKDVRMTGACASMIAEYFYQTQTPMTEKVAGALAYGIKMDTADFIRGVTDLDIDMFAFVYKQANMEDVRQMYTNLLEFSDLKAFAAAIENITIYDSVGFAKIPFNCPDALIAIISDFILSLDVVTVSVIYALRPDGAKFSVRSELPEIDAGKLIRGALQGHGNGGGHKEMAGGFIDQKEITKIGIKLDRWVEHRFLDQIRIKGQ